MSSLLSDAQKSQINNVLNNLHDTFKKDIIIYSEVIEENLETSFNALYKRPANLAKSSYSTKLTSEIAQARVHYVNEQKELDISGLAEMGLKLSNGIVRLKVTKEVLEKILTCSKIEVDDVLYSLISDQKNIGPFGNNFYMLFLKREN